LNAWRKCREAKNTLLVDADVAQRRLERVRARETAARGEELVRWRQNEYTLAELNIMSIQVKSPDERKNTTYVRLVSICLNAYAAVLPE
jgi:hypothetical protein